MLNSLHVNGLPTPTADHESAAPAFPQTHHAAQIRDYFLRAQACPSPAPSSPELDAPIPASPPVLQARPRRAPLSLLTASELGQQAPNSATRRSKAVELNASAQYVRLASAVSAQDWNTVKSVVRDLVRAIRDDAALAHAWDATRLLTLPNEEATRRSIDKLVSIDPLSPPQFECWMMLANFERNPQALVSLARKLAHSI